MIEKPLQNGYEIIQSVKIDGMEIIVAENPEAEEPYMMWRRSLGESFGAEMHLLPIYDSDYLKILREFIECQSKLADNISLDRIYRGTPIEDFPITSEDCVENGMSENLTGKVVAVKADVLSPEYRSCSHQLMLVEGGFGCAPDARGQAVFGVNIYSGSNERWSRSDILGVVTESVLPHWVQDRLASLQKPSVLQQITSAREYQKHMPEEKRRASKSHEPEH